MHTESVSVMVNFYHRHDHRTLSMLSSVLFRSSSFVRMQHWKEASRLKCRYLAIEIGSKSRWAIEERVKCLRITEKCKAHAARF